jgi:hypothetical protein
MCFVIAFESVVTGRQMFVSLRAVTGTYELKQARTFLAESEARRYVAAMPVKGATVCRVINGALAIN